MKKKSLSSKDTQQLLNHIYSLHVASRDEIGGGAVDRLLRLGLIKECWPGSYALTEAGERARHQKPGSYSPQVGG